MWVRARTSTTLVAGKTTHVSVDTDPSLIGKNHPVSYLNGAPVSPALPRKLVKLADSNEFVIASYGATIPAGSTETELEPGAGVTKKSRIAPAAEPEPEPEPEPDSGGGAKGKPNRRKVTAGKRKFKPRFRVKVKKGNRPNVRPKKPPAPKQPLPGNPDTSGQVSGVDATVGMPILNQQALGATAVYARAKEFLPNNTLFTAGSTEIFGYVHPGVIIDFFDQLKTVVGDDDYDDFTPIRIWADLTNGDQIELRDIQAEDFEPARGESGEISVPFRLDEAAVTVLESWLTEVTDYCRANGEYVATMWFMDEEAASEDKPDEFPDLPDVPGPQSQETQNSPAAEVGAAAALPAPALDARGALNISQSDGYVIGVEILMTDVKTSLEDVVEGCKNAVNLSGNMKKSLLMFESELQLTFGENPEILSAMRGFFTWISTKKTEIPQTTVEVRVTTDAGVEKSSPFQILMTQQGSIKKGNWSNTVWPAFRGVFQAAMAKGKITEVKVIPFTST